MNEPAFTKDTLYYDGACGLCRRSTRILRALDWLGRLEFRDSTTVSEAELPTTIDMAMQGIPMRTRSGEVLVGFPAMRRALRQTPLGVLPGLLMYVPGVSAVGDRVYRTVASRRSRDSSSCPTPSDTAGS